jgi:hypothetical protein
MTFKTSWRLCGRPWDDDATVKPFTSLLVAFFGAVAYLASGEAAAPQDIQLAVANAVNATPSIVSDGNLVAVTWGATSRESQTDVMIAVSSDGGSSFGPAVQVNADKGGAKLTGEAPPRAVFGRTLRSGREVTVLWTAREGTGTAIRLARSADGGRTFAGPVPLVSGAPGARGWPALALDQAGNAHAIWLDHRGMVPAPGSPSHVHGAEAPGVAHSDSSIAAQKSGLYYASSRPSTSRPLEAREIAKGVCYCCKTALAARNNRLYAAWRHVYPGNLRDIAFTTSMDDGRTFAAPVRVSRDGWEIEGCPDDGPAIAVDDTGAVRLVWPTVIPGSAPQGAIFYASSTDGQKFTARVHVPTLGSLKPSHPVVALDAAGRIVVAWDELVNGRRVVAARLGTPGAGGAMTFGPHEIVNQQGHGVYPAVTTTGDATIVAWTAGGSDSVINVRRITLRPRM